MSFECINVGDIVSFEGEDYIVHIVDRERGIVRVDKDLGLVGDIEWQGAWVDSCLAGGRMSVRWDRGIWP